MQIVYQLIAGTCTAAFIAVVFYLLVFWQNPDVPVSTGFILGVGLTIYGIYRMVKAKTRSKRSDAHVLYICRTFVDTIHLHFMYHTF